MKEGDQIRIPLSGGGVVDVTVQSFDGSIIEVTNARGTRFRCGIKAYLAQKQKEAKKRERV